MISITRTGGPPAPERRRSTLEALTIEAISQAPLQEGQDLDFKREVNVEKPEGKARLLDDVVAFLNRGPARIIVGVEEKSGRFSGFRPLAGDADKVSLRLQALIQDGISPMPIDVQVVPLHLGEGFVLDIQIPGHVGGPFMNRVTGGYLIRSGARNLPIDPGMLRSRFVDEAAWIRRVDELTVSEDAELADGVRVAAGRALRIGILPREHFDHSRASFVQDDHIRAPAPTFHEHSRAWFTACGDGHEALIKDLRQQGIERLYIRDDWFLHAHISYALHQRSGEGSLALHEFDEGVSAYLTALGQFLADQAIEGPFAITLALQSLGESERFGAWFPNTPTVRMLRPRLVAAVDDTDLITDFLRKVRQASVLG